MARHILVSHYLILVCSSLLSIFAGGAVVHKLLAPDLVRCAPAHRGSAGAWSPAPAPTARSLSPTLRPQTMLDSAEEYDDKPEHKL